VTLSDGSKVWLNAASSLKYPTAFTGKDRTVELSGEAYFQVAKNVALPFKVNVLRPGQQESLTIEVLGTEFNVMAYADEADQRTTLIDGAVKVSAADNQISLEPGQQARLKNAGSILDLIPSVDTDNILAWKNGLFKFQDAPIQDIMRQVSRWYDVEVVYGGKVDQQFIGTIRRQVNISTLLTILESTGWVHFLVDGKKITVLP
jgi:ferric-dicitrate binding protein FerR (iron transport regulator)